MVLLEEPQAAFYCWLQEHRDDWRERVEVGERILVCDIGGGTSDFTLIEVADAEGNVELRRVAVGKHLLLGGDNMDLTLGYTVARRVEQEYGQKLELWQIVGLTHACREAKEKILSGEVREPVTVTVLGRGSSVIGGSLSTTLTPEDIQQAIIEGFLPACRVTERPQEGGGLGLRSMGLQYARDVAITRHLAAFLLDHEDSGDLPTAILFNGGVSRAKLICDRILQVMNSWLEGGELDLLPNSQPDLAVALGAAWYGLVRHGQAIRIRAGSARNYYLGVESSLPAIPGMPPPVEALCVVPYGTEEGSEYDVPYEGLGLEVGTRSRFAFFSSVQRRGDEVGDVIADVSELEELPALEAELDPVDENMPPGTLVPVRLHVVLTEVGTLQIWAQAEQGERRWKLEYEVREPNRPEKERPDDHTESGEREHDDHA